MNDEKKGQAISLNSRDVPVAGSARISSRLTGRIPFFFILAPFILRALPCSNAFWFDEIWSWQIARYVRWPWQIITEPLAQSDNNHPLNTLWLYLLGDTSQWWLYRLLSLFTGCAMVLLILRKEAKIARFSLYTVSLLLGLSFPLITYSSEARGYAPMLLCAVAGYYLLRDRGGSRIVTFAAICVFGLLSHLTFLHFLIAAAVWVLVERGIAGIKILIAPAVLLIIYFLFFVRHLHIGGAPDTSLVQTAASTLSLILGGPMNGGGIYFVAIVTLICILAALTWLWRQSRSETLFFLTAIFLAPICTLLLQSLSPQSAPSLQVRYLLVPFTFSLILLSRYFAAALQTRHLRRPLSIAILALATLGNGYHLGRFLAVGRGDYQAAFQRIASQSPSRDITWTTDNLSNVFRISTIALYYQRFLPPGTTLHPTSDGDWLIFNVDDATGAKQLLQYGDSLYAFDSAYPAYGLSGWTWVIYKKR